MVIEFLFCCYVVIRMAIFIEVFCVILLLRALLVSCFITILLYYDDWRRVYAPPTGHVPMPAKFSVYGVIEILSISRTDYFCVYGGCVILVEETYSSSYF